MIIASITLVVPRNSNSEFNQNRVLGKFEFLHLPRVGDDIYLPISFGLEALKVTAVNHRPREYPRIANPIAPSEDSEEPHITIWAEETY